MTDYAEMYKILFRAQTKAIELLQKAQQESEEMYISLEKTKPTEMEIIEPMK